MDKFEDECLKEKTITKPAGAKKFSTEAEKNNKVHLLVSNSDYFLNDLEFVLQNGFSSLIYILGFYAMEHRANAFIAKNGFEIKDHTCTKIFLSNLGKKELATMLQKAADQRTNHYRMNLDDKNPNSAKEFYEKTVKKFVEEIDRLIKEE
ncbi:MAG: hypothetical protein AABW41_05030 [Nanoarchaeota archaeon]